MNEHSALRTLLRKKIRACDVALEKCQPQCQPQIQYICYICIFAAFAYCIFATNLLHLQHSIRIRDNWWESWAQDLCQINATSVISIWVCKIHNTVTDWSVKYTINVQLSKKYVTGFLYLRTPLVPIFNLVQFLKAKILLFKNSVRWLWRHKDIIKRLQS